MDTNTAEQPSPKWDLKFEEEINRSLARSRAAPERGLDCEIIPRVSRKTRTGFALGAIQVCSNTELVEASHWIIDYDDKTSSVSARCEARLPADGTHVSQLARAPVSVDGALITFSDPCLETEQWMETVSYRMSDEGVLWRATRARIYRDGH
jgi:hypothetical protein